MFNRKLSLDKLKENVTNIKLDQLSTASLTFNQALTSTEDQNRELFLISNKKRSYKFSTSKNSVSIHLNEGGISKFSNKFSNEKQEILANANGLFSELIKTYIDKFKSILAIDLGPQVFDLESEAKSHEWLRVTFHVLKNAINEASKDPNLIFDGKVYFGNLESEEALTCRLIIYNLDISFHFMDTGSIKVIVFDDKGKAHGSSKESSLNAEFQGMRHQVMDELIKLLQEIPTKL